MPSQTTVRTDYVPTFHLPSSGSLLASPSPLASPAAAAVVLGSAYPESDASGHALGCHEDTPSDADTPDSQHCHERKVAKSRGACCTSMLYAQLRGKTVHERLRIVHDRWQVLRKKKMALQQNLESARVTSRNLKATLAERKREEQCRQAMAGFIALQQQYQQPAPYAVPRFVSPAEATPPVWTYPPYPPYSPYSPAPPPPYYSMMPMPPIEKAMPAMPAMPPMSVMAPTPYYASSSGAAYAMPMAQCVMASATAALQWPGTQSSFHPWQHTGYSKF